MNPQFQHSNHHGDFTYEMVIPAIRIKGKVYTAADLQEESNARVLEALIYHAWATNSENERDEESFDTNGIFKIVYADAPAVIGGFPPAE